MNKVKIDFTMIIDGKTEEKFSSSGFMDKNNLHFQDLNSIDYNIAFTDKSLKVYKTGQSQLELYFFLGKTTDGKMTLDHHFIKLNVFTHRLQVSSNQLSLVYHLLDGNQIISRHHMKVAWIEEWKD